MSLIWMLSILLVSNSFISSIAESCTKQTARHRRSVAPGVSTYHNAKLDDIINFRIEHLESRNCLVTDGQRVFVSSCDNGKDEQVWKMDSVKPQVGKLINKKFGKCLSLSTTSSTQLILKDCRASSSLLQWTCFFPRSDPKQTWKDMGWPGMASVGASGRCVSIDQRNRVTMKACTNFIKNKEQNIQVFDRKLMGICAKAGAFGDQTTSPDYYMLNNPAFKLDWNIKYVEVYVIYSYKMYNAFVTKYRANAMKKITEHSQEITSMLDKFYRKIKFRILLKGIEVFKSGQTIYHGTSSRELHKNVGEYMKNLKKTKQFDIPIYLFEDNLYGAAGTASHNFCSTYWGPPFIISHAGGEGRFSARYSYNILTHEVAHLLHSPHNYDPPHTCPSYHLFGGRCTLGGNDYPKGFSSGEIGEIRKNRYSCIDNKPSQSSIHQCGNGVTDPGEECDCGRSQSCLKYDRCCDGSICKLKKGAECSNEKCCNYCKIDTRRNGCSGSIQTLTSTIGYIQSPSSYVRNVLASYHIKAPTGSIVSVSLHIPKFEFEEGCPFDYIEVKDGPNRMATSLGKFCRTLDKVELHSSSSDMFITVKTDQSFVSEFKIMYTMLTKQQTVLPGIKFIMKVAGSQCYAADATGTNLKSTNACDEYFMFTKEKTIKHIKTGKCIQPKGNHGIFYYRTNVLLNGDCISSNSVFVVTGKPGLFHPASGLCLTTRYNSAALSYCDDTSSSTIELLQSNNPTQPGISNGDQYAIKHYGGRCLSLINGAQYFTLEDNCQDLFEITKTKSIRHIASGKCIAPASHNNNAYIIPTSFCDSKDSVFKRTNVNSLQHEVTGKCIHPHNGYLNPPKSSKVVLYSGCTDKKLQFNFQKVIVPSNEVIITHSSGLCLQVPSGSSTVIFSRDCTDKFIYARIKVLIHKQSKKCLVAASASNGAKMILTSDCTKAGAIFQHTSKGSIKQLSTSKCIHPNGGRANPGTQAVLWQGCDENRLKFTFA